MKEKKEKVNGEEHGIDSRIEKLRVLRNILAELAEEGFSDDDGIDVHADEVDVYRVLCGHEMFSIAADRVGFEEGRMVLYFGDRVVASFPADAAVMLENHIVEDID